MDEGKAIQTHLLPAQNEVNTYKSKILKLFYFRQG